MSLTSTDKANIDEFGPPAEVALTLATNVLTPANQQVKILEVNEVRVRATCVRVRARVCVSSTQLTCV